MANTNQTTSALRLRRQRMLYLLTTKKHYNNEKEHFSEPRARRFSVLRLYAGRSVDVRGRRGQRKGPNLGLGRRVRAGGTFRRSRTHGAKRNRTAQHGQRGGGNESHRFALWRIHVYRSTRRYNYLWKTYTRFGTCQTINKRFLRRLVRFFQ